LPKHDVLDLSLAARGRSRIAWAGRDMPVIARIKARLEKEQPFKGVRIAGCLHITTETANLALALQAGGADSVYCASNPLSTQDDVAAALVDNGIPVYAINGEDDATYYGHIMSTLEHRPQLTVDDGADLVTVLHTKRTDLIADVIGGTEETTTGVIRLRSMQAAGQLKYPLIAVNDAMTKHFFDNRYGTGQSTIDGITRATNLLWAGKNVVVGGYGWCGRGIAMRAHGLGAHVTVLEVDPVRALEATMDGFTVKPLMEAAKTGEVYVTATGDKHVIDGHHMAVMPDGTIICNSGHFNVEINIPALEAMSSGHREVRPFVEEYQIKDGRKLYLLGEGRLINLAAAEGHPASVMDMSFANQALCLEYLLQNHGKLKAAVHTVPPELDVQVASLKLESMGVACDTLTEEQRKYLNSWEEGT